MKIVKNKKISHVIKKYLLPLMMFLIFESIAVTLWLTLDNAFYLYNFTYIGGFITLGLFLYVKKFKHARLVVQFGVGLYMFLYLGIISRENMQIEGFWYYLFLGVFEAATIHYVIAKIFGPVFFGRGWCGYACWTAMILDLLPFKTPKSGRKSIGYIRYIIFLVSFLFVCALFVFKVSGVETIIFYSFIIGNLLYFSIGIMLAFTFKDNRAFCKYLCPIPVFMKPASYFSLLRIKVNTERCNGCNMCKKVCPMNVDMTNPSRKRTNGTECILCFKCIEQCSQHALHV